MDEKQKKVYTYEDYCKIEDGKRYEVISGIIYLMSPGAGKKHQDISVNLVRELSFYLKGKKCKVYHPPFDVRLPKEGESKQTASNIVQPDIFVVCDKNKLDNKGCFGAPDLVVEILSPSTAKRDKAEKFKLYQEHKVFEYWIIDPLNQTVELFILDEGTGKYKSAEYFDRSDTLIFTILPGFAVNLEEIFPPPEEYEDE